jgi:hypothetical protein
MGKVIKRLAIKKLMKEKLTGHEREVKSGRANEMDMNWGVVMEEK